MTSLLSLDDIEAALTGDGLTVRRQVDDVGTTELCVEAEDALPVLVRLDSARHVVTWFCAWQFEDSDELARLQFANRMNDARLLVRFCVPAPDVLWCDHQQAFGTTLPADALVQAYRTFARVCFSVPDFDEAGLLSE